MSPSSGARLSQDPLDLAFAALADPTRRRLIALLREAPELRVSDLAACFDMSLNGVSKHLKVLERAGLVTRRIEGRVHWIRVRWEGLQPAAGWLDAHKHFWNTRIDALIEALEENE